MNSASPIVDKGKSQKDARPPKVPKASRYESKAAAARKDTGVAPGASVGSANGALNVNSNPNPSPSVSQSGANKAPEESPKVRVPTLTMTVPDQRFDTDSGPQSQSQLQSQQQAKVAKESGCGTQKKEYKKISLN